MDPLNLELEITESIIMDDVNTAITMAHKLGMKVVAEGIETQEQLEFLRENKCDYVQGYLLSRPLTMPQLHHFLVNNYQQTK
jgi:EAL domain-containing protein (putative c-di-GMP-specific phosphodiesterase class I)